MTPVFINLVAAAYERDPLSEVMKAFYWDYRKWFTKALRVDGSDQDPMLGNLLVAITEGFAIESMVDPAAFRKDDIRKMIARVVVGVQKAKKRAKIGKIC